MGVHSLCIESIQLAAVEEKARMEASLCLGFLSMSLRIGTPIHTQNKHRYRNLSQEATGRNFCADFFGLNVRAKDQQCGFRIERRR